MRFNPHYNLSGLHAPFSPSQPSWLRYNDEKTKEVYLSRKASEMGTRLHEWAKTTIDLGIKQPRSKKTIYAYVNDAIGFKMKTEVILYFSVRFFGTADAICFRENPETGRYILRIHDLKTGKTPVHREQVEVYAALFCLEYKVKPSDIDIELRIYQYDDVDIWNPTVEDIAPIMDRIVHLNKILEKIDFEED